jgi:single-stranded-DNA-specific exonuclease
VPNLAQYLDLVALGTVADVVPLDANNRIMVHQGVARMRAGKCLPGIKALAEIAKRSLATLTAQDLGFALGPRLNAAGRLEDMSIGIKCLLADNLQEARHLATALDQLNKARRQLEQDMVGDAELLLAQNQADTDRVGLTVYHETFHQGVVGIVAGRLREKFHKPVIAFADAGDAAPDELKGSARSITDLHIRDVLDWVASSHPGLLLKFGGHAMAAGLSIKRVHLTRFAVIFDKAVQQFSHAEMLQARLITDGELDADELSLEMAQYLSAAGPWGSGFPEPTFCGVFELVSQRVVGEHHLKMVLKLDRRVIDAIAFRQGPLPSGTQRVRAVYKLSVNDYGQIPTAQLMVDYLEAG